MRQDFFPHFENHHQRIRLAKSYLASMTTHPDERGEDSDEDEDESAHDISLRLERDRLLKLGKYYRCCCAYHARSILKLFLSTQENFRFNEPIGDRKKFDPSVSLRSQAGSDECRLEPRRHKSRLGFQRQFGHSMGRGNGSQASFEGMLESEVSAGSPVV